MAFLADALTSNRLDVTMITNCTDSKPINREAHYPAENEEQNGSYAQFAWLNRV
nr:hypothetical protein [uncultured Cohaesibacter sp.]